MDINKKKFSLHTDLSVFEPATEAEKEYMVQMRESTTFFKDGVKRLLKNKVATVSFIIIILITLSAIIIPMFWPYSYDAQLGITPGKPVDASYANLSPFEYGETELERIEAGEKVFPHVFGTDAAGRDYFIRVVYGTRISLAVGFFASLIVLVIGMLMGSVAGYCGGRVDLVIMRIVDVIYSLPDMLMVILLAAVLGKGLEAVIAGTVFEKLGANMISGVANATYNKKEYYRINTQDIKNRLEQVNRKIAIIENNQNKNSVLQVPEVRSAARRFCP